MTGTGQAVWITGASSGIGAALANEAAARGSPLVLSGRNEAALRALAESLPGTPALILPFEATDRAALAQAVAKAQAWSGGIAMLVNNAGISQRSLAIDTAIEVYDRIVAVDLLAPIALTQAVLPGMVAQGSGRIVMISSVAGKVGVPMRTAYCATKFGLVGYADALRSEVAGLGLSVHVVAPGSVRTDVSRNALTADGTARGRSDAAIEAGLDPAEVAVRILDAVARGEREIVVATGAEQAMAELRRTPEDLMDRMAQAMERGYARQMEQTS